MTSESGAASGTTPNGSKQKIKNNKPPTFKDLGFPTYSLLHHHQSSEIFVAGGGGKSKTGIRNCIAWFRDEMTESSKNTGKSVNYYSDKYEMVGFFEFPAGFGAPMNMAFVKDEFLLVGIDNYTHVLRLDQTTNKLQLKGKFITVEDGQEGSVGAGDPYQKVIVTSKDSLLVATGGTDGVVRIYDTRDIGNYFAPTVANLELREHKASTEIDDLTFIDTSQYLASVSAEFVCIWRLGEGKKVVEAELVTKLDANILTKSGNYKFKFARFGSQSTGDFLYTVALDRRRNSYLCKFNSKDWKMLAKRMICKRPITAISIDPTGNYLAFGTSDGSVGLVQLTGYSMSVRWTAMEAHSFTVTSVAFNSAGTAVISGSPDQTCNSFPVRRRSSWLFMLMLISIIVLALSVWLGHIGFTDGSIAINVGDVEKQLQHIAQYLKNNSELVLEKIKEFRQ